jgi:PAS domain S-box-containing protein
MSRPVRAYDRWLDRTRPARLRLGLSRSRFFVPDVRSTAIRVSAAIALAFLTVPSYQASRTWAGPASYLVIGLCAVLLSAWIGRFGAGLITLSLCALSLSYFFVEPVGSFELTAPADARLLLLFLGAGALICLLVEALHLGRDHSLRQATERLDLADELWNERDRLDGLVSNLPGLVWEARITSDDPTPLPTYLSANAALVLDLPPAELELSRSLWQRIVHPDDLSAFLSAFATLVERKRLPPIRHRLRAAGPTERWFETHASVARGGALGRHLRCVTLEITEAESARRALAESEVRFRALADRAPIMVLGVDGHGRSLWCNRAWLEFRGRTLEEEIESGWRGGLHPEDAAALAAESARGFAAQREFRLEFRCGRHDGAWRWILAVCVPRLDRVGEFLDFLCFAIDISERKQLELEREDLLRETERARREAELATRSKDEFLASVSHELRNPLNGILGWTHILRSGAPEEELARGLELIDAGARSLAQLVDDLLDVSRIIAGKMQISLEPSDLRSVVDAACQSVRPAAAAKGVALECDLDRVPPVLGDARRLQQVAWNLLSNAVKFTPRGGRVRVELREVSGDAELTVSDTGVGIAPQFLPQVFAPFVQEESTTSRRYKGLGLGLAIVRHLVEQHGGTIVAASDGVGLGASFRVRLRAAATREIPVAGALDPALEEPEPGALSGLRVLVVDDDPATREMLVRLLGRGGATVRSADSAAGGFAALLSLRPHVVLSDIEMPGEDGYSFLRRIRTLSDVEGGATPAAALTAFARESDRKRALLAGYQAHLAKPVDAARLVATVARLAGRH